ncbi:MAG: Lrp/AsnC family transcriptional regulator [Rhizobiales bacterium]|nr:Lrp/AsnC family transcriptional regulator [Hyphomicrobiales bacterium]
MDAIDIKILDELQRNPDIPVTELAIRVGLSHTPCWRRVKKLEKDGAIKGRAVLLDASALDLHVVVFASLRLRQHDEETLEALESATRDRSEITECYSMSGDSDYILKLVVKSIDEYENLLKKVLLHLPGVAVINSHFTLKCIKNTTHLPIKEF